MDKDFDNLLKYFDLEFSHMRSVDGTWHFKKINGHWHFKDTRMHGALGSNWMYFNFSEEIEDIVYSPLTRNVPGIVYRTEHSCETYSRQIDLVETYDELGKDKDK